MPGVAGRLMVLRRAGEPPLWLRPGVRLGGGRCGGTVCKVALCMDASAGCGCTALWGCGRAVATRHVCECLCLCPCLCLCL
jgi:hypothetical protein